MKILTFVMMFSAALVQIASSQHGGSCTVPLSALQCGGIPTTSPSPNQLGLPGKRGPSGMKGEKGESDKHHDIAAKFTKLIRRLELLEEKLDPVEDVCDKSEVERLQANLSATEARLAESIAKVETLEEFKLYAESQLSVLNQMFADMIKLRSCRDVPWQQRRNGSYIIRPDDSIQPFTVDCQFQESTVITSVGHDSEEEVEVTCEQRKCHSRVIQYEASYPQMRALIDLIGDCRQFIKYRCHHSSMLAKKYENGGWLSWNGELQLYWGGADRRPNYCACGVAGNCASSSYKCNCDANDNVEREDSGYLSYEDDLPVHTMYFGDTGAINEWGFHTLGKLECLG